MDTPVGMKDRWFFIYTHGFKEVCLKRNAILDPGLYLVGIELNQQRYTDNDVGIGSAAPRRKVDV